MSDPSKRSNQSPWANHRGAWSPAREKNSTRRRIPLPIPCQSCVADTHSAADGIDQIALKHLIQWGFLASLEGIGVVEDVFSLPAGKRHDGTRMIWQLIWASRQPARLL